MKKLYRKSTVHPSLPIISDYLSFLPATILTLTVALSADDKEVLAYLISCSNTSASSSNFSGNRKASRKLGSGKGGVDHAPLFDCDCFMCYRRYWARWDASPNRQLIHEIIDAYEDGLAKSKGTARTQRNCKKDRKKRENEPATDELDRSEVSLGKGASSNLSDSLQQETSRDNGGESNEEEEEEEEEERGSVRRFVSFVGEKIWSAWGQ